MRDRRTDAADFDLNIERVLEAWTVSHAIRELIANALDERALTGTAPVQVERDRSGGWIIRDYGRGLRHTHLSQNESSEKHARESEVIGRFGVGLKDALAVLDRNGASVTIRSRHGVITLVHRPKAGFEDVRTLHARVWPAEDERMLGTEVLITGIADEDIAVAKAFFLEFSAHENLESTRYGDILQKEDGLPARIYVKGLVVAEEQNFAFSYNITSLTEQMRRALNRERTNVGRSAYSERVKTILLSAESQSVAEILAEDLGRLATGSSCDEVRQWTDVAVRAAQILNTKGNVVFATAQELIDRREMVDRAIIDGRQVVTVPDSIRGKLDRETDLNGRPMQSIDQFYKDWSESVKYEFVSPEHLTEAEKCIFDEWRSIAAFDGGVPSEVTDVVISSTMRPSVTEGFLPEGLWESETGRVIIKRDALASRERFAGVLLHELVHARTGYTDVSRNFESALTASMGRLASRLMERAANALSNEPVKFSRKQSVNAPEPTQSKPPAENASSHSGTDSTHGLIDAIQAVTAASRRVSSLEAVEDFMTTCLATLSGNVSVSLRPSDIINLFRKIHELALAEMEMAARVQGRTEAPVRWSPILAQRVSVDFAKALRLRAQHQEGPLSRALNRIALAIDFNCMPPSLLAENGAFLEASRFVAEFHDVLPDRK